MELSPASPDTGYFAITSPQGSGNLSGRRLSYAEALAAYSAAGTKPVVDVTSTSFGGAAYTANFPGFPYLTEFYRANVEVNLFITYDTWFWGDGSASDAPDHSAFLLQLVGEHALYEVLSTPEPDYFVTAYTSPDSGQTVSIGNNLGLSDLRLTGIKVWRIADMPGDEPEPEESAGFWTNFRKCREVEAV